MMDTYLRIDIGTTHIKALLFSESGAVLSQAMTNTPISTDDWGVIHEAESVMDRACQVVREVLSRFPADPLRAISCASVAEEGGFLDRYGQVIYPAVAWFEQRESASMVQWRERQRDARLLTGLPNTQSYSLMNSPAA